MTSSPHVGTPYRYVAFGRVIASEIEVPLRPAGPEEPAAPQQPHLVLLVDDEPAPTGRIEPGDRPVLAHYDIGGDDGPWYVATDEGDHIAITFRDTGRFRISRDLRTVRCAAVNAEREALLPVLFSGTVLALLLLLEERLVLHASAVSWNGRVLAFVGQSGRGKTTMAAMCAAAGAVPVTDDVLLVDPDGPVPMCRGTASEFRLRPAAESLADQFGSDVARRRATADERVGIQTRLTMSEEQPLGAIVVPSPSRELDELTVRRLSTQQALFGLLGFPRIEGVQQPAMVSRQFALHAQLVQHVPVYEFVVPWGPPFEPALGREILERFDDVTADTENATG